MNKQELIKFYFLRGWKKRHWFTPVIVVSWASSTLIPSNHVLLSLFFLLQINVDHLFFKELVAKRWRLYGWWLIQLCHNSSTVDECVCVSFVHRFVIIQDWKCGRINRRMMNDRECLKPRDAECWGTMGRRWAMWYDGTYHQACCRSYLSCDLNELSEPLLNIILKHSVRSIIVEKSKWISKLRNALEAVSNDDIWRRATESSAVSSMSTNKQHRFPCKLTRHSLYIPVFYIVLDSKILPPTKKKQKKSKSSKSNKQQHHHTSDKDAPAANSLEL
jgi:hypothetical protein